MGESLHPLRGASAFSPGAAPCPVQVTQASPGLHLLVRRTGGGIPLLRALPVLDFWDVSVVTARHALRGSYSPWHVTSHSNCWLLCRGTVQSGTQHVTREPHRPGNPPIPATAREPGLIGSFNRGSWASGWMEREKWADSWLSVSQPAKTACCLTKISANPTLWIPKGTNGAEREMSPPY